MLVMEYLDAKINNKLLKKLHSTIPVIHSTVYTLPYKALGCTWHCCQSTCCQYSQVLAEQFSANKQYGAILNTSFKSTISNTISKILIPPNTTLCSFRKEDTFTAWWRGWCSSADLLRFVGNKRHEKFIFCNRWQLQPRGLQQWKWCQLCCSLISFSNLQPFLQAPEKGCLCGSDWRKRQHQRVKRTVLLIHKPLLIQYEGIFWNQQATGAIKSFLNQDSAAVVSCW